jgi:hypothetical protein
MIKWFPIDLFNIISRLYWLYVLISSEDHLNVKFLDCEPFWCLRLITFIYFFAKGFKNPKSSETDSYSSAISSTFYYF